MGKKDSKLVKNVIKDKEENTSSAGVVKRTHKTDDQPPNVTSKTALGDKKKYNSDYPKKRRKKDGKPQKLNVNNNPTLMPSDLTSHPGRSRVNQINDFKKLRSNLPIGRYRNQIIDKLATHDVIVLQGPTGCGKSTHVPQFILDNCKVKNKPCKIIVTQPRRIAAMTVARRVCQERNWNVGDVCGYQVGLDNKTKPDTILSFVTTGVLLQKLINEKTLREYTHIIVDEVHERSRDMDFLLLIIRKFLSTNSHGVKIILMSATINTNEFSKYFKTNAKRKSISVYVIQVKEEKLHNVHIFYGNQLKSIETIENLDFTKPRIEKTTFDVFVKLIAQLDELTTAACGSDLVTIRNILVFLPGILEIENAHTLLRNYNQTKQEKGKLSSWHIIPLYSALPPEEQRLVFQPPPRGTRKIILSTNIAENSITVPDILYVVDFCLTKTMIMNPETQYQSLQLQWASQTQCNQRAGRVGRVSHGVVIRLVPKSFYNKELDLDVKPEILRAPLHDLVLSAKRLQLHESPREILTLAMNPPMLLNLEKSILFLKEIGGLALTCRGRKSAYDGDITFLGEVMASLPIHVKLSKFIILGHIFGCLEDCIIMATGCSLSVFKASYKNKFESYCNRLKWADNSTCDFIAHLNLYKAWKKQRQNKANHSDWCAKNFVSLKTLKEWNILVKEVKSRLEFMKIKSSINPGRAEPTDNDISTIIQVVICGSFYPNYFKLSKQKRNLTDENVTRYLKTIDSNNTVYFSGFPSNQPHKFFTEYIKEYLQDCASDMKVLFDITRVYVQFLNCNEAKRVQIDKQNLLKSGKINMEVYRSVYLRRIQKPCIFEVTEKTKTSDKSSTASVVSIKLKTDSYLDNTPESCKSLKVSPPEEQCIKISIIEINNGFNFWARKVDEDTISAMAEINRILNDNVGLNLVVAKTIDISKHYIARKPADNLYYRCKVYECNRNESRTKSVLFIDYGDSCEVRKLYELPNYEIMKKPPLAFNCHLSEIKMPGASKRNHNWSKTAKTIEIIKHTLSDQIYFAKIDAVINNETYLELYKTDETQFVFKNSLNSELISLNCAERIKGFAPSSGSTFKNTIQLIGPYSDLEVNVFSIIGNGYFNKKVNIDNMSVNCITLDANPEDSFERLIVAGNIQQSQDGLTISLKHTSIMPNIDGFPMLMSLLFCPLAEIKPSADGTRVASILCGLGSHDKHKSLNPSHDITIILDTELSPEDIKKINELRHWMNKSIEYLETSCNEGIVTTTIEECQKEVKRCLHELLQVQREAINVASDQSASVWGKFLYDSDFLPPDESGIAKEIWPPHTGIKLVCIPNEKYKSHMNELEDLAKSTNTKVSITCKFCKMKLQGAAEIKRHIVSNLHKNNVSSAIRNKKTL